MREFPSSSLLPPGVLALFLAAAGCKGAGEKAIPAGVRVRFSDREQGAELLGRRDEFVEALSPFDRAARMKSGRAVSEEEFLAFARRQALGWTQSEITRLSGQLRAALARLESLRLPLPRELLLVKTTGLEEGQANYTRGAAIFLPRKTLDAPAARLEGLLLHELFHILSRQDPALRRGLYQVVGFQLVDDIELPEELRPRKITNPDAPRINCLVELEVDGQSVHATPLLVSSSATFDVEKGGELFTYLKFHLLAVEKRGGRWLPLLRDGKPWLLDPHAVPSFHEKIGRNTKYIIHPDEVLADNFVLLATGKEDVPTPGIIAKMREVMESRLQRQ